MRASAMPGGICSLTFVSLSTISFAEQELDPVAWQKNLAVQAGTIFHSDITLQIPFAVLLLPFFSKSHLKIMEHSFVTAGFHGHPRLIDK
jgi:hypothetical protein